VPLAGKGGGSVACREKGITYSGRRDSRGNRSFHTSHRILCSHAAKRLPPTHLDPASGLAYQPRRSYYQPPISRSRCAAPPEHPRPISAKKCARGTGNISGQGLPAGIAHPSYIPGDPQKGSGIIHNLRLLVTTGVTRSDTSASPGDTHATWLTRS